MKVNSFIPLFYLSSFSIPLQKGSSRPFRDGCCFFMHNSNTRRNNKMTIVKSARRGTQGRASRARRSDNRYCPMPLGIVLLSKHESLLVCGSNTLSASPAPASLVSFLPEQERYPPEAFTISTIRKTIYCDINFLSPQGVLSNRKVRFPYEKIPFSPKKVIDLSGKLRYNMLA